MRKLSVREPELGGAAKSESSTHVDGSDLGPLRNHQALERVLLAYCSSGVRCEAVPSDHLAVLASLPNLRRLALYRCEISRETVDTLGRMSGLEELDVSVCIGELSQLGRALPKAVIHLPRETLKQTTEPEQSGQPSARQTARGQRAGNHAPGAPATSAR